jgi:curved DNA-binding protein CbpA
MINIVMEQHTLYDDLELPKNCTFEEIKQKYRILAQIHHPDKGGDVEKFKKIKLAYEVLSDVTKREHYDSTGDHYNDNNLNTEVFGRLNVMLVQFIPQINPEFDDLILRMKVEIRALQDQTTNSITECNNSINKLTIITKKIKLKKEGENLLKSFAEKKIKQQQAELINFKRGLIVFARMLEILEDYHYSNDEWQLLIQ